MKKKSSGKRYREIYGIVLFALAALAALSVCTYDPHDIKFVTSDPNVPLKNFVGPIGAYFSWGISFFIGRSIVLVPILLLGWSMSIFFDKSISRERPFIKAFGGLLAFASLSTILAMSAPEPQARMDAGGVIGAWMASDILIPYLGRIGGYLLACTLLVLSFSLASDFLFVSFLVFMWQKITGAANFIQIKTKQARGYLSQAGASAVKKLRDTEKNLSSIKEASKKMFRKRGSRIEPDEYDADKSGIKAEIEKVNEMITGRKSKKLKIIKASKPVRSEPTGAMSEAKVAMTKSREAIAGEDDVRAEEQIRYEFPATDLLQEPQYLDDRNVEEEVQQKADLLIQTMRQFNVDITVKRVHRGPVLTTYEVQPAPGIKVNSILNLSDDLAMILKAESIRVLAPIPGKSTAGVEVPNKNRNVVYLREMLENRKFYTSSSKLMLALGKDILGNPLFADLTEMPHLLIAGTTNSGKTVCINSIIMSLIFRVSPNDVKLLLIDPKMVELICYNGIPHLLNPVITEAKKVPSALNWLIMEMERRYTVFSKLGVRNIEIYHKKMKQANGDLDNIPYIVTIIDELADLMLVASQEVEGTITRLAQLARAVGIHLILATQRPSVDVVTGLIKANFPTRISFKVASRVDSRTILDSIGADKLLGKGDMLYMPPGSANLTRAQCCYVTDEEIEAVVGVLKGQGIDPQYANDVVSSSKFSGGAIDSFHDDLYDDAVRIVLESQQASASFLQRRMRIGYARAARLVDMMEMNNIVSPQKGSKARDVLVSQEEGSELKDA